MWKKSLQLGGFREGWLGTVASFFRLINVSISISAVKLMCQLHVSVISQISVGLYL